MEQSLCDEYSRMPEKYNPAAATAEPGELIKRIGSCGKEKPRRRGQILYDIDVFDKIICCRGGCQIAMKYISDI